MTDFSIELLRPIRGYFLFYVEGPSLFCIHNISIQTSECVDTDRAAQRPGLFGVGLPAGSLTLAARWMTWVGLYFSKMALVDSMFLKSPSLLLRNTYSSFSWA